MKNKLIKATILIAVTTLVMLNIQILFDTSNSTFFQGSTAKAFQTEEGVYLNIDITKYIQMRRLKLADCWDIDVDLGAILLPINGIIVPVPYFEDFKISTNGTKWICKKEDQIVLCEIAKMTDCESSEKEGGGEEVSQ